jgi:hypothetical protein
MPAMTETKPKRRWFKFSLRTLFVLVTIAGVGASWVTYQLNWIQQRHVFLAKHALGWASCIPTDLQAPWQLRLFGETNNNMVNMRADNSRVAQARELFPELFIIGEESGLVSK